MTVPLHKHHRPHHELRRRYRHYLKSSGFRFSAALSFVLFLVSVLVVQPLAVQFATERASNSVTDIILSNIPVYDMDGFFVYGMFLLIGFVALLLFAHPKRIPFTLLALTLFVLIRCVFVSLTHLAPDTAYPTDFGPAIQKIFFGGDLFFSGHTGAPFLLALIYWREEGLRYLFLAWSAFFGVIVLLGHYHYSIDVFAAFFITYSIYHVSTWMFTNELALFNSDVPDDFV